jgi:excisionase family DNA binding protein
MTFRNDDDAAMTLDEVALMHRVSRRSVERWIAQGKLSKSKLPGGLVRISRSDAEALLTPSPSTNTSTNRAEDVLPPSSAHHSRAVAS